ncbi:MAG: DUF1571 domain-containing protein [Archangium sp.]|nr:DUF1571 domain-containing protein [Archangium sp.]
MTAPLLALLLTGTLAAAPWGPMTEAERKAHVARLSKEEIEAGLRTTPPDLLLRLSAQAIVALGPYQYIMVKQERIRGTLQGEQTIRTTIQEDPNAIRLEYLKGPSAGRKLIYNSTIKKNEFRVREAGFLAIVGRLWIPLDSDLTKNDSNHTVAEAGLGSLVRRLQLDQKRAGATLLVEHEGWNASGHFCSMYVLPDGGKGFDNAKTRVCTDVQAGVPMKIEGFDAAGGLIERYAFSDLKPITLEKNTFDPETGL